MLWVVILSVCTVLLLAPTVATTPGYIMFESDGGLSNRLRSMISHMFMAKVLHNQAHLVMVWEVNDACPGHFLQLFQPLDTVTFITNSSKTLFEKNALKVYPNSRDGFERTLLNYDVNFVVKKRTWWNIEMTYWKKLKWVREVDIRVENYVARHSVCNITSMHIRRTDMDLALDHKKRMSYTHYYRWIAALPDTQPVFLMTDNSASQLHFQEKYGADRILVYANISSPNTPTVPQTASNETGTNSTNTVPIKLAVDHRFTTLEHALVDILIAAHARDFRPALFSSVSELVRTMNFIHRWKWCGCTYQGC